MATRNEATHVVLSPQRDLRGLFRATVAVVAALVIGMGIGRVIDNDRAAVSGNQAAVGVNAPPDISQFVGASALTGVVPIDEAQSGLSLGARQFATDVPGDDRYVGASEELIGSLQAVDVDAAKWAASARLFGLDNYLGDKARLADAARLTALAEVYEPRTGGDIWERGDFTPPYNVPTAPPAEPTMPEPTGPHGMQ